MTGGAPVARIFALLHRNEALMPTSQQLERETRASRERLSQTIDELKTRLAPSSMMDEATAYLRRAVDQPVVADAPSKSSRYALPLALVGAGLAWLAVEAGRAERERNRRERLAAASGATMVTEEDEVAAIAPAVLDPDLETMNRAMDRRVASGPLQSTAEAIEPHTAAPEQNREFTAVETVIVAPAPLSEEEKQEQRSFP
jgi:hypothetical protein